jgi:hypothetical protein
MVVVELFPSSAYLGDLEQDSSQSIGVLCQMSLQCCPNLVGGKTIRGEKFDDNAVLQFHQNKDLPSLHVLSIVMWAELGI